MALLTLLFATGCFYRILEQLRRDHVRVMTPNHAPFTSVNDVAQRLLPYHVFQGTPPCEQDFAKGEIHFIFDKNPHEY